MENIENISYIIGARGAAIVGAYKGYQYFKKKRNENSSNKRQA